MPLHPWLFHAWPAFPGTCTASLCSYHHPSPLSPTPLLLPAPEGHLIAYCLKYNILCPIFFSTPLKSLPAAFIKSFTEKSGLCPLTMQALNLQISPIKRNKGSMITAARRELKSTRHYFILLCLEFSRKTKNEKRRQRNLKQDLTQLYSLRDCNRLVQPKA